MELERSESGPFGEQVDEALLTGAPRGGRSDRRAAVLGLACVSAGALALLGLIGRHAVGSGLTVASSAGKVELASAPGYVGNFKIQNGGLCVGGCKNGGVCLGYACRCVGGWRGKDCSDSAPAPYNTHGGSGCNMGFDVFPYAEAERWGTKYSGWEQCAGKSQSPINILSVDRVQGNHSKLGVTIDHDEAKITEVNNGHSLEVDGAFLSLKLNDVDGAFLSLNLGGISYTSGEVQFHVPSEHHKEDQEFPLEMQVVTTSESGGIAIIAILFTIGDNNECLNKVLDNPPNAGCEKDLGVLDLTCFEQIFAEKWYAYEGSLTTPPCTEDVHWMIMKSHATLSRPQLEEFKKFYTSNNRPIQDINGRTVTLHEV